MIHSETLGFKTIFDRNKTYWGDAKLIQEFKGKILKFLDLKENDIRKYIEFSNEAADLNIVINKPFKNDDFDIKEVNIKFNLVDEDINPACMINDKTLLSVVTSKYIEGETLWEVGGFNKPTRKIGDLQHYISYICEYIERSLAYNIFSRDVSFYHQISPVNIKIISLKEDILYLVVTDIGSSIQKMVNCESGK